jgi:hypothetical protein
MPGLVSRKSAGSIAISSGDDAAASPRNESICDGNGSTSG